MPPLRKSILVALLALALVACGGGKPEKPQEQAAATTRPATPVTVGKVERGKVTLAEPVIGRIESANSPSVKSEVPGTISRVLVDAGDAVRAGEVLAEIDTTDLRLNLAEARAEVTRLETLHANQERNVGRFEKLYGDKVISEGAYDDARSQLKALAQQLTAAQARLQSTERNVGKAVIRAPVAGYVQSRNVAPGDFVDAKAMLFQIATDNRLRVVLPFPESISARIRPGLAVRLTSPQYPEKRVVAKVESLRPMVTGGSRAIEAVVQINNPGGWSPGASVNGELILAEHDNALLVSERSVVRRPAGEVVYVVADGTARQRVVTTGVSQEGKVEILSGLNGDESVVVDGSGFLTDKTPVAVKN